MKGCKVLLAVVIGLMTISSAAAQQATVVANVPFNFSVHDITLPAGEYTISGVGDHLLYISGVNGKHLFITINSVDSVTPKTRSELVFHRYGEQYFLSEVWMTATETGDSLPPTKRERQMLTRTGTVSGTSVIAQLVK